MTHIVFAAEKVLNHVLAWASISVLVINLNMEYLRLHVNLLPTNKIFKGKKCKEVCQKKKI